MQPNPLQPQPSSFNPNTQQAKQKKLIRLIIILAVVTVVVLILVALLAPKDIANEKLSLALARHQEISRVLDEYSENARSAGTRQLVANAKLVVLSGTADLTSSGVSVSTAQADSVKIAGIDDTLLEASRNNAFDEAITQFVTSNLEVNAAEFNSVKDSLSEQHVEVVERLLNDYDSLL
ncbi:MAG TPA: hypothetical protein VF996_00590 [Candidatus Saccharimonadales bacterium]|jgi:hypothetical protein